MAPHSSTLAWKIPWMEEPGRLQSMGSLELDMTERLHFHFSLSCIEEGNGNPLQCSCLENSRDGGSLVGCNPRGRWSRAWLNDFTFTFHFHASEREMTTHSTVLAWRIPGMGSLVGCHLWGCTELDTTKVTQQQQINKRKRCREGTSHMKVL